MKRKIYLSLLLCAVLNAAAVLPVFADSDEMVVAAMEATIPAPRNLSLSEDKRYPYLGLSFRVPENLLNAIGRDDVFVTANGSFQMVTGEDGMIAPNPPLDFGYFSFHVVPESERGKLPGSDSPDAITDNAIFEEWLANDTLLLGRISVFHSDYLAEKNIEDLTGLNTNTEIGTDGDYHFYYSTAGPDKEFPEAVQKLADSLAKTWMHLLTASP